MPVISERGSQTGKGQKQLWSGSHLLRSKVDCLSRPMLKAWVRNFPSTDKWYTDSHDPIASLLAQVPLDEPLIKWKETTQYCATRQQCILAPDANRHLPLFQTERTGSPQQICETWSSWCWRGAPTWAWWGSRPVCSHRPPQPGACTPLRGCAWTRVVPHRPFVCY